MKGDSSGAGYGRRHAEHATAFSSFQARAVATHSPNLDETKFVEIAKDAEKNCPVSKVLRAAITLDAKLI